MTDELARKIQEALDCERPPVEVTRHPPIHAAIEALRRETGTNRQEIIWRAIRMYLLAYLHTHRKGLATKSQLT